MNSHALAVLEFPRALDEIAVLARSGLGAERVRALEPRVDPAWIEREHARVAAVRSLRDGDAPWQPEPAIDIREALERLRVTGARWAGEELLAAKHLLQGARRTLDVLTDDRRPAAARAMLEPFVQRLLAERSLESSIERAIADDGTVKDEASPALRRIRRELRASEGELIRLLEKQLAKLDESFRVPDMSVTMRNGRYVIPVRREGRHAVSGIVHDTSASGGTLFVEPPAAVEFGNRVRELAVDEREEVDRILATLTDLVRPRREALAATLDALAELDSLHARAAFAARHECAPPAFVSPRSGWVVNAGRHPLLLAQGVAVVPFDLEMSAAERTIVVSGPNTGGKTVLLKAVGLMCAMAQAGIPPAVGRGSRLPIFDDFFADIGDEQSIQASLSTFSAHLLNLGEILRSATAASLVLIDELGSGTDPLEGAALGWAILEEVTRRGATTLATSHLGALKELATQVDGVVNGSLQFDAERLVPTYRFVKGLPGRSYGIAIARTLRLPEPVVSRAEQRLPTTERDLAALLETLEQRQAALAERERELTTLLEDARRRIQTLAKREQTVRERERQVERLSRQEARKYLLNARAEIERTVRDLRKAGPAVVDEKARAARQQAERLAAKQATALEQLDLEESQARRRAPARRGEPATPAAGDAVRVETLGGMTGRVLEVRGEGALVAIGSLKSTVPLRDLTRVAPEALEKAVVWHGELPEAHVQSEIDVRGMRPDEAETVVLRTLDDAIRADLPVLRVIHGKGTGVLRAHVAEMLSKDTRVKKLRPGAWNEGGSGVTIAELR